MALVATVNDQISLVPSFKDDKGNDAPIESVLGWDVSDPTIAGIFPATDLLSAKLKPLQKGTVQASIRVDARFGPDVKEIIGVLDVQFEAGEATIVTLTGTVEPLEP
jgi:hypothetical protein